MESAWLDDLQRPALGNGPSPTAVAVSDGAVWVANRFIVSGVFASGKRGTVSRIDPQTNAVVATITVGHEPFAIAAGYGAVWVTNRTDSTMSCGSTHARTRS